MKNLYTGLKAQINPTTCPLIKFVSMWNGQTDDLEEGKSYDFLKPAVFFEFANDQEVDQVGNNVQVFDPLDINVHIVHDFYNASDGTMEVNLDIFDIEAQVHAALQMFKVVGTDFGSGPIGRVAVERDYKHSNIYHLIVKYRTTWTDNSQALPIGGYEIDPTLKANLTITKIPIDAPVLTASVSNLAFPNTVAGQSITKSFTISGTGLKTDLTFASGNSLFTVSLDNTNFGTLEMITPEIDESVTLTTIYVKFSPVQAVTTNADLNYGVVGLNSVISLTGTGI